MIRLTLPFPPSVNMITTVARGRKITSKRGRAYRSLALSIIKQNKIKLIDAQRIKVELNLYPPTKAKRDIDNYSKAILDVLTEGGVYIDDSIIYELNIKKLEPVKQGKVDVIISELN